MGYIYKITNIITKMMYVGQTTGDLNERFRKHCNNRSNCRYLKNAIKKYGKESFKFELICIAFDSDLDKFEKEYIIKFNTIVPNGYNIREGGQSGRQNEETKLKISETLKKGYADGTIPKQYNFLGKTHTEEEKRKISEKLKGRKFSDEFKENCRKRALKYKVQQYSLDCVLISEYEGIVNAAKAVGCQKTQISAAARGKLKTVKGFIWKYVNL